METPWGELGVADAHVHFFSHAFFAGLADQKKVAVSALGALLDWQLPDENPEHLADAWVHELARRGVERAALIASVPGDDASVSVAVAKYPGRFYGYAMVNPVAEDALPLAARALNAGIRGLCFFPAMHCYSIQDELAAALLDLIARTPSAIAFVHCGVLSLGIRKKLGLPSRFDMRFSNPLDLHAVALRYPGIRFVVPHFGAGYFREALMLCDLCPNVYLDTSSSNSWMRYQETHLDLRMVFQRALDVAGPRRLLFGTDSSYFPRGWNAPIFEAQSKALYEIGAPAETARLILRDNLIELFS